MDPAKPPTDTSVDGVAGLIQPSSIAKTSKQYITSTTTPFSPTVSTEVNTIQSIQTPDNKKKDKEENKNPRNQQENPKAMAPENDNK